MKPLRKAIITLSPKRPPRNRLKAKVLSGFGHDWVSSLLVLSELEHNRLQLDQTRRGSPKKIHIKNPNTGPRFLTQLSISKPPKTLMVPL